VVSRELSFNPKLGTYTIEITDKQGNLIAVFQWLAYRKRQTHEPGGKKAD
jgi:acyl-CoA thioesterase